MTFALFGVGALVAAIALAVSVAAFSYTRGYSNGYADAKQRYMRTAAQLMERRKG